MQKGLTRWVILAALAALASVTTGGLWAAGRPRPKPVLVSAGPVATINMSAWSPSPGTLAIQATGTGMIDYRDNATLWWTVEVRRTLDDGSPSQTVWEHAFDDVAHYTTAKKGVEFKTVLKELRVPFVLPPGTYHAFVSLREDVGVMREGELLDTSMPVAGRASNYIEVAEATQQ